MRIVLDTNVFISALVFNKKIQLLLEELFEKHTILVSSFILKELSEKLKDKFHYADERIDFLIDQLNDLTHRIDTHGELPDILSDKDDNHILLLADEANADLIISGDKGLYELKSYKGILIIKPSEYKF